MRTALVFGLCLIAFAASAGPRSQPVTDEAVAAERLGEIDRERPGWIRPAAAVPSVPALERARAARHPAGGRGGGSDQERAHTGRSDCRAN